MTVLLIDDDHEVLDASRQTLELEGFAVEATTRPEGALNGLGPSWPGVVVTDVRMPGLDGFALLERVRAADPEVPVVLVTGHGDIAMAMRAVRGGAYDFIEKPAEPGHLVEVVRRALEHRRLVLENRSLRAQLAGGGGSLEARIIGRSAAIERLRAAVAGLADAEVDVLLFGETGTGKELIARSLHDAGRRRAGNFVALNCGALPDTIIESELFGHEPGAFTGAQGRRIGKLEHADGGTLFLDEIESMPMHLQVKLLRVLQERVIERVGGNRPIPLDLRVVAATKVDLLRLAGEGRFREDLYYRLNVVTVPLPPLRERREDVPLLLRHFLDAAAARARRPAPPVDAAALARLAAHGWPGNVREMRNVAERMALGLGDGLAGGPLSGAGGGGIEPLTEQMDRVEKQLVEDALARCGGRVGETADKLGITRKTLYLKMRHHGLHRGDFTEE
ncbi:two-component system C4-dicarboxylate transport response regulator DctD [Azospirillum baldaniorum]|uniref:sigma-54-dependent transcriptional regulator n=1 Tax=Azospirillum baldaniorum TaxID=1064539 RepID=UPI0011A469C9|nr:sigma-54 dependent transcriptional regulator [Azospirillum baldaniorum]TWA58552.1 two-component system C4-dicarboxylate transport response regulator DctD [Azospirillum baldaniorum]